MSIRQIVMYFYGIELSMNLKLYIFFVLFLLPLTYSVLWAQEQTVKGVVLGSNDQKPLESVNVLNLSKLIGTITDDKGVFEIVAEANDTLYLSFLGYKPIKVRVTNDWINFKSTTITLIETALALEEVEVSNLRLTGYLEIDAKKLQPQPSYRYSISGLEKGYEAGNSSPNAMNRILGSIFNPADMLYNMFGKRPRQFKRLREMRDSDYIRETLRTKFDRETLLALLQIERSELDEILGKCNYSSDFVQSANDLQVLDAISQCYEEFKVLNRDK